jgi:hypothetical protein
MAAPESQGVPSSKLEALKDDLAARRTKAFLVVHDDRIIYEWYAADHSATKPHGTASMAKGHRRWAGGGRGVERRALVARYADRG